MRNKTFQLDGQLALPAKKEFAQHPIKIIGSQCGEKQQSEYQ